jgi:hypothetical protein
VAISSFLTEGAAIPQGSAVTDMTKQTILPDWYSGYAQDILAGQRAIADRPYATAPMPRVAGFTPAQLEAFQQTGTAAGAYQPLLGEATAAARGAASGPGALSSAQPYYGQALSSLAQGIGTSGAAAAQPYFGQAQSLFGQSAAADASQAAQPYYGQALSSLAQGIGTSGAAAAQPYFGQAQSMFGESAGTSGVTAAQPYMNAAGQSSVSNIGQYMNPYMESVVNRIGELGTRNLSENIMPQIEGRYIQAGQLGYGGRGGAGTPSGMMTDTARAVRDTSADILGQQTAALQSGYTQAAGLSAADLARQGQLASTAGNLAQAQQQALSNIGQQQANIGAQMGNLTQGQQSAILAAAGQQAGIGTQLGNLAQGQQQALTNIGTQQANIGAQMGNLTQGQQSALLAAAGQQANIGTQSGNLAQTQQQQQLAASGALSGLAGQAQGLGLTGAGALGAVGAQQQQQGQRSLDVAYQDFLRQQGYPQEQINNMLNTFKGVATGVPSATQEQGISPSGVKQEYPASTASQIGGSLTTLAGILKDAGVFGKP